jgi:hypothetical protein
MVAQVINGASVYVPGHGTLNAYQDENTASALGVTGQYLVPQQNQNGSLYSNGLNIGSQTTVTLTPPSQHPGAYDNQELSYSYAGAYYSETGQYPGDQLVLDILLAICLIVAIVALPYLVPEISTWIIIGASLIIVGGMILASVVDNSYATTFTSLPGGGCLACGGGSILSGKTCVDCDSTGKCDPNPVINPILTDTTTIAIVLGAVALVGVGAYLIVGRKGD